MAATDHLGIQFSVQPGRRGKGSVIALHPESGQVGELKWAPGDSKSEPAKVVGVDVDPGYRHQGIATAMYHRAGEHTGQQLAHSAYRTDPAEGWSARVGGHRPDRIRVEDY